MILLGVQTEGNPCEDSLKDKLLPPNVSPNFSFYTNLHGISRPLTSDSRKSAKLKRNTLLGAYIATHEKEIPAINPPKSGPGTISDEGKALMPLSSQYRLLFALT